MAHQSGYQRRICGLLLQIVLQMIWCKQKQERYWG